MKARDILEFSIIEREGYRNTVYIDTTGNATGGYGHKILPEDNLKAGDSIPEDTIEKWLNSDCEKALDKAGRQAQELNRTSPAFIAALGGANFQLGDFEAQFPTTFNLLKQGAWQAAISNLSTSKWFHQTPVRVNDLIAAIRLEYNPTVIQRIKSWIGT